MLSALRKVKFISKDDTGEVKTEFILKPLKKTSLMVLDKFSGITKENATNTDFIKEMVPEIFTVLKEGIDKIKNFQVFGEDDAVEIKEIKKDEITDTFIDENLSLDLMMELFGKIVETSKLSTSEAKN